MAIVRTGKRAGICPRRPAPQSPNDRVIFVAMARILDMHEKWMEAPAYRKAYEAIDEEFALAAAAIDARNLQELKNDRRQEFN